MGRVVFQSEWMTESEYASVTKHTWYGDDYDGDSTPDYSVTVPLKLDGSKPWGTTTFYGTPDD